MATAKKTAEKKIEEEKPSLKKNGKEWNRALVMDVVCNALASCSSSIKTILDAGYEGQDLPDYATLTRWMEDSPEICNRYARAKEAQAEFMAEELSELHKKAWIPVTDKEGELIRGPDGQPYLTVDKASCAAVKLEADNKKWLIEKLKPKKYGAKLAIGGADDLPPIKTMTNEQLAARVAALQKKVGMGDEQS